MKKIHKIINIALIFTLTGATFCQDLYALRIPVNGSKRVGETLASGQEVVPVKAKTVPKFLIEEAVIQSAFSNIKTWIKSPTSSGRDMAILCIWIIKTLKPNDHRLQEIEKLIETKIEDVKLLPNPKRKLDYLESAQRLSVQDIFNIPNGEESVSKLASLVNYDVSNPAATKDSVGVLIKFFAFTQDGYLFPEKLKYTLKGFIGSPDRKLQWFSSVILSFIDKDINIVDGDKGFDDLVRNKDKYITREVIREALELSEGNRTIAGRIIGLTEQQMRRRVEKFNLDIEEIANEAKIKRTEYIKTRAREICSEKKEDGRWNIPIPRYFSSEDITQVIEKLSIGHAGKNKSSVPLILKMYAKYVENMHLLRVDMNCCTYGDVVGCIVNEAMKLIMEGSEHKFTNAEIAAILGISENTIRGHLKKIKNIIVNKTVETPFLPFAPSGYRDRRFKIIQVKEINKFLFYVKNNHITKESVITKHMLESYIAHAHLMKQIGVTKTRNRYAAFVSAFIELAEKKIASGDDSPVELGDIGVTMGYPDEQPYRYVSPILRELNKRIKEGWADIFAADRREDDVFKKAFLGFKQTSSEVQEKRKNGIEIQNTLELTEGNVQEAMKILNLTEGVFYGKLKRYEIDVDVIRKRARFKRNAYLSEKARRINAGKKGVNRWDVPLPASFPEENIKQVIKHLEGNRGKKSMIGILEEYKEYVDIMNEAGIRKNSTFYGDVIGCIVNEALELEKKGDRHRITYEEVAKLLSIPLMQVEGCIKSIKERISNPDCENAFLPLDTGKTIHKAINIKTIKEREIEKFFPYIKTRRNGKPFISREILEFYVRHVMLMQKVGIEKTRNRYEDFIETFLNMARKKIRKGDNTPINATGISIKMGYSPKGAALIYSLILDELNRRIEEGWVDIFATNERENEIFTKTRGKTLASGQNVKIQGSAIGVVQIMEKVKEAIVANQNAYNHKIWLIIDGPDNIGNSTFIKAVMPNLKIPGWPVITRDVYTDSKKKIWIGQQQNFIGTMDHLLNFKNTADNTTITVYLSETDDISAIAKDDTTGLRERVLEHADFIIDWRERFRLDAVRWDLPCILRQISSLYKDI